MRLAIRTGLLVALLLSACEPSSSRDTASASTPATDTGRVAIDGGWLFWEAAGAGNAVILLHGGNLDRRMWDTQFALLKRNYRVIRYDARGFGKSSAAVLVSSFSHVLCVISSATCHEPSTQGTRRRRVRRESQSCLPRRHSALCASA